MLFSISQQLIDTEKVRRIGIGLEVTSSCIDRHLHNERNDITEAALKVLNQINSKVAHTKLCDVLRKVGMSSCICFLKPNASHRG